MLDAADTVRDAGLSVDAVTSSDPPVGALVDAGIIPDSGPSQTPANEQREQMLDLLREIAENTGGS